MIRKMLILIIVSLFLNLNSSYADNETIIRGVTNTFTGWMELPKNIYFKSVEENGFVGITVGLVDGIGMSVVRTSCGIYETIVSVLSGFQESEPILYPEYVTTLQNEEENIINEIIR